MARPASDRTRTEIGPLARAWKPTVQTVARQLRLAAHNALTRVPGKRPKQIVVDLVGAFPPRRERPPTLYGLRLPGMASQGMSLQELFAAVDALGRAPWLESVVFRIHRLRVDQATAHALRRAIHTLGDRGKRTISLVTQITEAAYVVAAAADEIVAPESAEVQLRGFGISVPFVRDALAKLGLRFERIALGQDKTALEELVRDRISDEHRAQLGALLRGIERIWIDDIAADRRLHADDVRRALDEGVTSAHKLHELGFLDRVAYEDEVVGADPMPLREALRYLPLPRPTRRERIAVISLIGIIVPGVSRRAPFATHRNAALCGAETIARCFREARADPQTVAIVLYVDSPGGSALASDLIWREVQRTSNTKPVVVAMGGIAASGGYYAVTAARHVIATPATLTGSIGVVLGKLVMEPLLARLGVNVELLQTARFAHLAHPARPLSDEDKALLQRAGQEIQARFTARVAQGRHLGGEQVDRLAEGSVWLGADAVRNGLADELGDIDLAIERAAELAGTTRDAAVWDVAGKRETLSVGDAMRSLAVLADEQVLLVSPLGLLGGV